MVLTSTNSDILIIRDSDTRTGRKDSRRDALLRYSADVTMIDASGLQNGSSHIRMFSNSSVLGCVMAAILKAFVMNSRLSNSSSTACVKSCTVSNSHSIVV